MIKSVGALNELAEALNAQIVSAKREAFEEVIAMLNARIDSERGCGHPAYAVGTLELARNRVVDMVSKLIKDKS